MRTLVSRRGVLAGRASAWQQFCRGLGPRQSPPAWAWPQWISAHFEAGLRRRLRGEAANLPRYCAQPLRNAGNGLCPPELFSVMHIADTMEILHIQCRVAP